MLGHLTPRSRIARARGLDECPEPADPRAGRPLGPDATSRFREATLGVAPIDRDVGGWLLKDRDAGTLPGPVFERTQDDLRLRRQTYVLRSANLQAAEPHMLQRWEGPPGHGVDPDQHPNPHEPFRDFSTTAGSSLSPRNCGGSFSTASRRHFGRPQTCPGSTSRQSMACRTDSSRQHFTRFLGPGQDPASFKSPAVVLKSHLFRLFSVPGATAIGHSRLLSPSPLALAGCSPLPMAASLVIRRDAGDAGS